MFHYFFHFLHQTSQQLISHSLLVIALTQLATDITRYGYLAECMLNVR